MTNLFQERYYKINKTLLILVGGWPYLSLPVRNTVLTLIFCIVQFGLIPLIMAVLEVLKDWEVAVESVPHLVNDLAFTIKLLTIAINAKKIRQVLEHIQSDWLCVAGQTELRILHEYSERGRTFTIAYARVYLAALLFMTPPVVTKLLQVMDLLNDSKPARFPLPVNFYGINTDANYFYLLPITCFIIGIGLTAIVAADTLFIVQVQHGCAMFSILGHNLKKMANKGTDDWDICVRPVEDPAFTHLSTCIRYHNEVIEFSNFLESIYSTSFLTIVGLSTIVISITIFQSAVVMSERPLDSIRYIASAGSQLMHLFFLSYFSQKLTDHSQQVREFLCEAEWYRTTPYAQRLFIFILMRTLKPCKLTAGKFFVMSFENFTSVVKTSLSYFTLLRSMY